MRASKPGKVIGLKIESDKPEESPQRLAKELAYFLQEEINASRDSREFREQALRERQKANQYNGILTMLREYNRKKKAALEAGDEWKPSRMEPMECYDEQMIKTERAMMLDRARDLDQMANEYDSKAKEARRQQAIRQKKLKT